MVFGAGGDRDRGKRPLMGDAARRLADRVIVTSDNPRSEDPEAIVDEVMAGAGPRRRARGRPPPRRSRCAIETAEPGDVVVIAGKGHEQGQEFEDGRKEPFDDVTVAREALRAARSGAGARVIDRSAAWLAAAAGGELAAGEPERAGPERAVIDSREVGPGRPVRRPAGRERATAASSPPPRSRPAPGACSSAASTPAQRGDGGHGRALGLQRRTVIAVDDPLAALHALARAWRRELGAKVHRRDRLDRQDLDQGHPRRAAARRSLRTHANREN